MKRITSPILTILLAVLVACSSKEDNPNPPIISLSQADGYFFSDSIAGSASNLKFRLSSQGNGDDGLTNLIVSVNGARVLDEGFLLTELERDITLTKTAQSVDSIEFRVRDITGGDASLWVAIKLDESSGDINPTWYRNITLKAQGTEGSRSFLSLADGAIFSLQEAFANQAGVHLLYYFDTFESDQNTISSPGANIDASIFPGSYAIPNWTVRNTVRFSPISISQADFEAINSVLFLVNSYSSGNRKAKLLKEGDTYSFFDESRSKYGMLRVNSVSGQAEGEVNISVVVQP